MSAKETEIEDFLSSSAANEGLEIIDVQYARENGERILRIFIDKEPRGVNMDDCERASRVFGEALDLGDIIDERYVLEVSSPGLDRVLKKEKDFKRFAGNKAKLQTLEPINNQRNFTGTIVSCENGKIKINDVTKGEVEIPIENVRKANLQADF